MFQYVTPQNEGLFHGAIAQSGVPYSTYVRTDRHPAYYARTLAHRAGCDPKATPEVIVSCLAEVTRSDPQLILTWEQGITAEFADDTFPMDPFKPVVDGAFYKDKKDAFVPQEPWLMFSSGQFNKVPLMYGSNREDGMILTTGLYKDEKMLEELNENWDEEMTALLFNRSVHFHCFCHHATCFNISR